MHGPRDKIGRATKLPTRERDLTGRRNAQNFLGANGALRRAYPQGGFDAHSGLGNFGDRDDFNRASGGPDVDPAYPVCLHVWGPANYYECSYTSLPQCNESASGRAAQCVINPYFASAQAPAGYRHHRRVY